MWLVIFIDANGKYTMRTFQGRHHNREKESLIHNKLLFFSSQLMTLIMFFLLLYPLFQLPISCFVTISNSTNVYWHTNRKLKMETEHFDSVKCRLENEVFLKVLSALHVINIQWKWIFKEMILTSIREKTLNFKHTID